MLSQCLDGLFQSKLYLQVFSWVNLHPYSISQWNVYRLLYAEHVQNGRAFRGYEIINYFSRSKDTSNSGIMCAVVWFKSPHPYFMPWVFIPCHKKLPVKYSICETYRFQNSSSDEPQPISSNVSGMVLPSRPVTCPCLWTKLHHHCFRVASANAGEQHYNFRNSTMTIVLSPTGLDTSISHAEHSQSYLLNALKTFIGVSSHRHQAAHSYAGCWTLCLYITDECGVPFAVETCYRLQCLFALKFYTLWRCAWGSLHRNIPNI